MNAIGQNQLIYCIGQRVYRLSKHTVRTGVQPSAQFKNKIRCISKKKEKRDINRNTFRKSIDKLYIATAINTTRPELPSSPDSLLFVLVRLPTSRR